MTLKEICDRTAADISLAPRTTGGITVTFCNVAFRHIAQALGCADFPASLCANDMIGLISKNWIRADAGQAQRAALAGRLAAACKKGNTHGHIAAVYPAPMQYSGTFGKNVPLVANVGRQNGIMRVSQAFSAEPDYYIRPA